MCHTGYGEAAVIDIEGDARECGALQVSINPRVRPPTISKTARGSSERDNRTDCGFGNMAVNTKNLEFLDHLLTCHH